jgi:hypothetical protein
MSLNIVLDQKYLAEVDALTDALKDFVSRWQYASTLEGRLGVESDAMALFERLNTFDIQLQEVSSGQYQELSELNSAYTEQRWFVKASLTKMRRLITLFLSRLNTQEITLMQLVGKKKTIQQKRAAAKLWSDERSSFVLAENFLTWRGLGDSFVEKPVLNIQTQQGIATLPIEDTITLSPKKVSVGRDSVGRPGNSNRAVTVNNVSPLNVISGDSSRWFEFEKLDVGPVKLKLVVEFSKPEVINYLAMEPISFGDGIAFKIEDIRFGTDGTSIRDLAPGSSPDAYDVKSAGTDSEWNMIFLPVETQVVVISLIQNHSTQIVVGEQLRKRFAIGVKSLRAGRHAFKSSGQVNSLESELPKGLYAALPVVEIAPADTSTYDASLSVTSDGGGSWKHTELDPGGETILLDGQGGSFVWRLDLERPDGALSGIASWSDGMKFDYPMQTKGASRSQSNIIFSLDSPSVQKPWTFQSGTVRRGDRFGQRPLGKGVDAEVAFGLPIYILDHGLDADDISIYVNRIKQEYVVDNTAVSSGQWSFADDYRELVMPSQLRTGSRVSMVVSPEKMKFTPVAGGFHHKFETIPDPDKETISIKYLPAAGVVNTVVMPKDQKTINLPHSHLLADTTSLVFSDMSTYTLVTNRSLLGPSKYFVDFQNGILELDSELGSKLARLTYTHLTAAPLPSESYDIVFEDGVPVGVTIPDSSFVARDAADTVGEQLSPMVGVAAIEITRDQVTSVIDAYRLSYDSLIPGTLKVPVNLFDNGATPVEVPYLNGKSEFLGLVPMHAEETIALPDTAGIVSFNLSAGVLWYNDGGVVFGDVATFVSQKTALVNVVADGDWYVANDGTVSIYTGVGVSLPAGISITYLYRDPDFNPRNKYSVNYSRGMVFSYAAFRSGSTLAYKVAVYEACYDIALPIESTFDKRANQVHTSGKNLWGDVGYIKCVWATAANQKTLRGLETYFSPLVSLLGFRFR